MTLVANRLPVILCAALLGGLLTLAACGGDDPLPAEPEPPAEQQSEPEPAAAPPPPAAPPPAREGRTSTQLLLLEAEALEENGFWEAALAARDRAIAAGGAPGDPQIAEIQLDQVRLLLRLSRPLDAERLLRQLGATGLSADDAQRHALLMARTALELDEPGPALEALDRYLELGGPARAQVQLERARLLERLGRVVDARHAADRAIADAALPDIERRRAIWFVATMLDEAGEAEAAIARYDEVVAQAAWPEHPDVAAATARIAALSLEIGDVQRASDEWQALVRVFSARAEALTALEQLLSRDLPVDPLSAGLVRYRHSQFDAAREQFIIVLSDPDDAGEAAAAEYYIAAVNEDRGETDGAILGYLAAIERDPGHALADNARWWAAQLLEQRGDSGEELYGELFGTQPSSEFGPEAATRYAGYALARGDWAEAAARFRDAANVGADHWPLVERQRLLLWSAISYRQAGDQTNADLILERTINLSPADWYALRAAQLAGEAAPELDSSLGPDAWLSEQVGAEREQSGVDASAWSAAQQLRLGGYDEAADLQLDHWIATHEGDAWALWSIARQLDGAGEQSAAASAAAAVLRAVGAEWWEAPAAIVRLAYPLPWSDLLGRVEQTDGVDPLLLLSLIRRESLYDADARGLAGEIGLTQVIPLTGGDIAQALGEVHDHERLARPETAIRYGGWYLGAQLRGFDSIVPVALAAYNAGPGNAARWEDEAAELAATLPADVWVDVFLATLDFGSTKTYVRSVMEYWAAYRALAAADAR